MRKITYLLMITLLIIVPLTANASRSDDLVDVRIQLKWFHQFQFAGYYAAVEQRYFRDAGLNVTLIEGGPHINPTEEVLAGNADFGIGTSGLLIYTLLISVLLILIITTVLAKFYTLNRSLQVEIRQRMALEEELQAQAISDLGTGVLNLRGFIAVLEQEIARADRADTTLSLLEIDLDNFKSINDEYGHAAGDEVLMLVTMICREEIRSIDSIGRIGGEEFMILLPETEIEKAHAVAKRIHARLAGTPLILEDGRKVAFTASIGVATQDPGEDRSSFMARTDLAMYEAKKLGRNTISVSMESD